MFKYQLASPDGTLISDFESSRCDWQPGDELRGAENVRYLVTAVIPPERVAEFVDTPPVGILEVQPL